MSFPSTVSWLLLIHILATLWLFVKFIAVIKSSITTIGFEICLKQLESWAAVNVTLYVPASVNWWDGEANEELVKSSKSHK